MNLGSGAGGGGGGGGCGAFTGGGGSEGILSVIGTAATGGAKFTQPLHRQLLQCRSALRQAQRAVLQVELELQEQQGVLTAEAVQTVVGGVDSWVASSGAVA